MTTETRTAADIEALKRAFELGCRESTEYREHLEHIARQSGWDAAAESAAYHFQIKGLKPWECPPSSCTHADVVNEHLYGHKRKEIALRKRLLQAGLSLFEPFPTEALKEADRKRRAARRTRPAVRTPNGQTPAKPAPVSRKNKTSAPTASA
jgi:hypothetical protein